MAAWFSGPGGSEKWSNRQQRIFDEIVADHPNAKHDATAARLLDRGWFLNAPRSEWQRNRDALRDYLWNEYEIDFNDVMPWEEWRDWYTKG